jgi:Kef-type K+ transport system membrane component KefB
MVLRELNSRGPVSDTLLGIIAINNLFTLSAYTFVAAVIELAAGFDSSAGILSIGYSAFQNMVFPLVWQLAGSAALGYLVGLLIAGWATRVVEHGEMLMLLAGSIMLSVGAARILDLSPLVASLSVGATMVNLSQRSRGIFQTLTRTDPPFYAIFFVLAGADLDLSLVPAMGLLGGVYVVGRAAGKFAGVSIGARRMNLHPMVQRWLGFTLLAQAGLAVGITLAIGRRFPDLAPVITTVVFSSVVIYELVGPLSARFALMRSGEANPQETAAAGGLVD